MVKLDQGKFVSSNSIRKIIVDLINENNYSDEEDEEEIKFPKKTNFASYRASHFKN